MCCRFRVELCRIEGVAVLFGGMAMKIESVQIGGGAGKIEGVVV